MPVKKKDILLPKTPTAPPPHESHSENGNGDLLVTDLGHFASRPRPVGPQVLGLDGLDRLLDGLAASADPNPPLNRTTVDVQGRKGSAKSTLFAGSPHCIYLTLGDGAPTLRRKRCRVQPCTDLAHFESTLESILAYAKTKGEKSKYTQVVIDPISILGDWMLTRECAIYNETNNTNFTHYRLVPEGEKFLFPMVGAQIAALLSSIAACGWGWVTNTHYVLKLKVVGRSFSQEWLHDVPGSIAKAVERMATIPLMVQKSIAGSLDGGEEFESPDDDSKPIDPRLISYLVEFEHRNAPTLGGRLPFIGKLVIPNMNVPESEGGMPDNLCPYDYLNAAYEVARERFLSEDRAFREAPLKN